jgi:Tfp pilus assembly protein PilP
MGNKKMKYRVKSFSLLILGFVLLALVFPLATFAEKISADVSGGGGGGHEAVTKEEYSQNVKELMHFLEGRNDTYTYQREGRPDPFMPFLRDKVVDREVDLGDPAAELVGMQKFEPGQLSVVGIIQTANGSMAMVQDSTGKGYIISPGIKLGRSGVVDEITPNMILVKQQYLMTSGATRHRIVKMMLKREGE